MGSMRKAIGGLAAAAMMATTATPALAGGYGGGSVYFGSGYGGGHGYRGYNGYRGGKHHRRHRRGSAFGDFVGAVAVVGVIAAIASSASKNKQRRADRDGEPYPERDRDDRANRDDRDDRTSGRINSESAAVDACAIAAEERGGDTASVRDITQVDRTNDGWDVEGIIEERNNWRDRTGERRRFTCSVRLGEVDHVYIDTGTIAQR